MAAAFNKNDFSKKCWKLTGETSIYHRPLIFTSVNILNTIDNNNGHRIPKLRLVQMRDKKIVVVEKPEGGNEPIGHSSKNIQTKYTALELFLSP